MLDLKADGSFDHQYVDYGWEATGEWRRGHTEASPRASQSYSAGVREASDSRE